MTRAAGLAAVVTVAAACDAAAPARLDDCGGDLRGVWRTADGARWHAIVGADAWELYPIEERIPRVDLAGAGPGGEAAPGAPGARSSIEGVVAAPSVIDLGRAPPGAETLGGRWTRRYERGAAICEVAAPVRLHGCRGDHAVLDVSAPAPPADFATCAAPESPPATWALTRER